jgi:signal transduction histidine kinase/ligand-binding sensor domain-containing protein
MNRSACRAAAALWMSAVFCGPVLALDPNRELTQYVQRIWQSQQGLPDATIVDILQSRSGYLWLATEAGLVRFDGVRFTSVERLFPGAPAGAWVRSVFEDESGTLWLATNETGVYALRPEGSTNYGSQDGLPAGVTYCVVPGPGEVMWICTEHGLARIRPADPQPVRVFHVADGLANENVRAACMDAQGNLWAGGDGLRLSVLSGGTITTRQLNGIPPAASVRAMACEQNVVWVGTTFGLIRIEGSQQRLYTRRDGMVDDFVFSLAFGENGTLWIGTRSGFSRLRKGPREVRIDKFRPQAGLSQSTAQTVFEDREGSLWVGTKRGLNQFADGRSIPYTISEGLPSNETGPVLQDASGIIWAGTLDAGLARFDGRRFTALTTAGGLPSNVIRSMAEDADRSLWIGTANGLARMRNGRVERSYTNADGLPSNDVHAIYRSRSGQIWVGTAAGLASFRQGRFVAAAATPRQVIRAIGEDRAGRIMFGTEEGLWTVSAGRVEAFDSGDVYVRNANTFYLDREGLLWIGLNGAGLRLVEDGKVTAFGTREGVYDGEIYSILGDDQDRLWMACSRGVFSVLRSDLRKVASGELRKVTSIPYSATDVLRVIEGRPGVQPAMWRMRDGRFWFSTTRGLLALNPSPADEPAPPVAIERPIVNGQSQFPSEIANLPGGQKNIEFNYTGLSFVLPELIRFRYKLEGYDGNWVEAGTRREASYANLPPGNYRFHVTACNFYGSCNEEGAAVEFTLQPTLVQRGWFWTLMAGLAGAMAWGAYQLHIRRLRERYDLIVSERSRIARELHDTLIQGFSGITMALQALATRLRSSEARGALEEIIDDAAACLRETRQSVSGLRAAAGPESGLAESIRRTVNEITETKDVRLRLSLEEVGRRFPPEVEYNLLRIASEAVSNAVKHSGASTIDVVLRADAEGVRLLIRDDGSGMNGVAESGPGAGHYGLIGMKERASQIGADLKLMSEPGEGTTVSVTLPAGKTHAGTSLEAVK